MKTFYSNNELKKFKKIKRDYERLGYPTWKAEQYAKDHISIDRRATDVFKRVEA